ncbi:polysaccharide biosynthesis/export family protein [Sphingomonas bacterium]|uniref:polysaccharide biosynthesis/export family protein n=1 Tax=Sphingomonas bacterium TaxID=1895847 RepID=UPI001577043A|nr:polysaccharide biosynthesis/export family protein [Sphingomonas bacterium]
MRVVFIIGSLALALATSACSNMPLPAGPVAARPADYTLAAGDKLEVTTFGFKELSGDILVAADDTVSLPLVGSMSVRGLTSRDLEGQITALLVQRDLVKSPKVSIQVTQYRPFFVLGEVNQPGKYDFTNGLTVAQAIATARGITYRGKLKNVFIRREGSNVEVPIEVTASAPVHPGDTVRVGERYF